MFGFGFKTIFLNEEMNGIMKIVTYLEESGLLINSVSETIKNEAKEQQGGFIGMLSGTLCASLLGNLLASKGRIRAVEQLKERLDHVKIFNAVPSFN